MSSYKDANDFNERGEEHPSRRRRKKKNDDITYDEKEKRREKYRNKKKYKDWDDYNNDRYSGYDPKREV